MSALIQHWLGQAALGLIATLGFALWFNVPRETLLRAGVVGMGGVLVRSALVAGGHSAFAAAFFGALFIGVFGYYRARSFHYPRVIFTVTGIIPLIPGIPAYQALLYFSQGDIPLGLQSATRAGLIVAALAGGLTAARAVNPRREAS